MLTCTIISDESGLAALIDEWRALAARFGAGPATDPDRYQIWWNTLGRFGPFSMHVVAGRREGKLAALLPLSVMHKRGIRLLQAEHGPGPECDALCASEEDAASLWKAAFDSPRYDFAKIKGVYPGTLCEKALAAFAHKRDAIDFYYLGFEWPDSAAWKAALSSDLRGSAGRYLRRLEKKGEVRFTLSREAPLPVTEMNAMLDLKDAALRRKGKRGPFDNPRILDFIRAVMADDAEKGRLFFNRLSCGGKVIAYNMGMVIGNVLHITMWTYDPAFSSDSPATVLLVNTISGAIDGGLSGLNLMYTTDVESEKYFKQKFSNRITTGYEYTFSRSLRGRLLESGFMALRVLARGASALKKSAAPPST